MVLLVKVSHLLCIQGDQESSQNFKVNDIYFFYYTLFFANFFTLCNLVLRYSNENITFNLTPLAGLGGWSKFFNFFTYFSEHFSSRQDQKISLLTSSHLS